MNLKHLLRHGLCFIGTMTVVNAVVLFLTYSGSVKGLTGPRSWAAIITMDLIVMFFAGIWYLRSERLSVTLFWATMYIALPLIFILGPVVYSGFFLNLDEAEWIKIFFSHSFDGLTIFLSMLFVGVVSDIVRHVADMRAAGPTRSDFIQCGAYCLVLGIACALFYALHAGSRLLVPDSLNFSLYSIAVFLSMILPWMGIFVVGFIEKMAWNDREIVYT